VVSFVGFMLTREGRIESTLKLVYTDDKSRVDADLVDLIKVCQKRPSNVSKETYYSFRSRIH
jgi:hypothetical protein